MDVFIVPGLGGARLKDEDLIEELKLLVEKRKKGNVFLLDLRLIKLTDIIIKRFEKIINKK